MTPDPDQLALDLEDARLRLQRLACAMAAKDEAEQAVRDLTRQLRQAQRRLKEAGWALSLALSAERRNSLPPLETLKKSRKGGSHEE